MIFPPTNKGEVYNDALGKLLMTDNDGALDTSTAEGTVVGVDSAVIRNDRVTAVAAR